MHMTFDINQSVDTLSGVGDARAKKLARLGINNIHDLIYHFPRDYRDLSKPQKITELREGEIGVIEARVLDISSRRLFRRRMSITTALVEDESGTLPLVWFNQPFLARVIKPTETYIFYGKLAHDRKTGSPQMQSPQYEKFAKIISIYSETEGLSSKQLRMMIMPLLSEIRQIGDYLPKATIKKYDLMPLGLALWSVHEPSNDDQLKKARRRLAFDELFEVVKYFILFERDLDSRLAPAIVIDKKLLADFVKKLPFTLTESQRIAAWRIIKSLSDGSKPLNALLNGDVGSGKTIVALLASLVVIKSGHNAVWMAPTSILASQHYATVRQFTANLDIPVELVTAATDARKEDSNVSFRAESRNPSEANIERDPSSKVGMTEGNNICVDQRPDPRPSALLIGTHALLHRKDKIKNIGLLVIDEQHRFGVEQRRELLSNAQSGLVPHFLNMTATPIPRSLAMLLSGLTDLITLKEKPKERKPVITKIVMPINRQKAYEFIDHQIDRGRQVFIITPLIKSSTKGAVTLFGSEKKAVEEEYAKLQNSIFRHRKIGLLHGKMKQKEKDTVMKQMLDREISILVSTTVVEVGVDVPNATVVLVENADIFGLAQLHQIRGRVGRSSHQSYCFLAVGDENIQSSKVLERLRILTETDDGFIIAQKDLELRGPGAIAGLEQSGFLDLKIASLDDMELLEMAKEAAEILIKK